MAKKVSASSKRSAGKVNFSKGKSASTAGKSSNRKTVIPATKKKPSAPSRSYKTPVKSSSAKHKNKPVYRSTVKKNKPVKRVSYKEQYVKLLEKQNKSYLKDIKAIRKRIEQPGYQGPVEPVFEAFPKEEEEEIIEEQAKEKPMSIGEQILAELNDIKDQMRARNVMFDELVHGSGKYE